MEKASIEKNDKMPGNDGRFSEMLKNFHAKMDISVIEISPENKIISFSPGFPDFIGFKEEVIPEIDARKIFLDETHQDLFGESRFSLRKEDVYNYRGHMYTASGAKILVQISGCMNDYGNFSIIIQKLKQNPGNKALNTGHFQENIKAHEIVDRYVAPELFKNARIAARSGSDKIPDEVRYLTFLFADLVSFTSFAENKSPAEVMETLNLSIGAASSTILRWNGVVDKIMGDSVMAFFENPLDAVISAVEIQKQFRIFNDLRSLQELEELKIRIGIHSGTCIHGSIGMERYMEWTVIGDAVNTASRLEKICRVGGVLVSDETLKFIRTHVNAVEYVDVSLRGKTKQTGAHYIEGVSFTGEDGDLIEVGIHDEF